MTHPNNTYPYKSCLKAALALLLLFINSFSAFSKAIVYEGRDGLSSNDISAIAKDDRGLMWIGTLNGLNIYDGYTFTKLPGILSNAQITALAIGSKAELFVGTNAGLYSVDLNTLQISRLERENKRQTSWENTRVSAIWYQKSSKTVFAAFEGACLAQLNNKSRLEITCKLPYPERSIKSITAGADNNLVVTDGDIYLVNPQLRSCTPIPALRTLTPVTSVFASGNTLLLNHYFSKLSVVDIRTFSGMTPEMIHKYNEAVPYRAIQSFLKGNKLYVLSENYSFYIVDLAKKSINEVSRKYPGIFEGKAYSSIYVDEHDIIWIATNKGLIKVEERTELFTRDLYNLPERVSTRKIIEDINGDIYEASYVGLWHYAKQTRTWAKYALNNDEMIGANPLAVSYVVQPLALLPVQNANYFYVGFDAESLIRFDKKKKIYEKIDYTNQYGSDKVQGIYALAEDKNGTIWAGCGNGLASYNPESNKFTLHHNDAFNIGRERVRYIKEEPQYNLLYVASTSGLYIIDLAKGVINHLNQKSRPSLTNDDILYIGQDKARRLWLGTNGGGINILSADLKSVNSIHKQDGLSSEVVYSIIPQDENTYWIGTFNGLDRYRKDQKSFSNFFEEDGLSSNEFNQNSFLKAGDGKMYFGSINGITSFYPQQFEAPVPFKIYLSGISQWNDDAHTVELLRERVSPKDKLVKKPSDLLFELHFASTDYSDPLRNSYSYRIKELSDNWISLEDRHTLNLGGIPYGNYVLEVKAINSRGATSANILSFHIVVTQPLYKTWWFFALILTGVAVVFYAAYLIKSQSFKNILHLRMKIASNLHDEVGSLLTRITMFSDNLRYSKNTEEQRNAKLEKIAVLSRDAVASMSDVLWTIDSRNDFAGNLLDRMREHTEEMLFPLGIDVNFVLSGTDLKQPISSDKRGEIYLIFKEAINNIAKHSEATRVDILYQVNDRNFLLNVTNNGVKGDISEISTGQGLSNMKMRAAKTGAKINVSRNGDHFSVEIKN